MKLRQLVEGEQALGRLLQQPVAIGLAYRLVMLAKQVGPYLAQFHKQQMETAKHYNKEVNGRVEIPKDKLMEFTAEMQPLLDEDVAISFTQIDPETLGINMTAVDMMVLDWLFTPDEVSAK